MKIKNNKKAIALIGVTGAVALGTIGFAAWQIVGNVPTDEASVNVSFGDVTSSTLVATESESGSEKNLKFDGSGNNDGTITSTTNEEDLTFSISYKVKKGSADAAFTKLEFNLSDQFDSLVTANYIVRPYANGKTTLTIDSTAQTKTYYSTHTNNATFVEQEPGEGQIAQKHVITKDTSFNTNFTYNIVSTFNFKWGTTFGEMNPDKFDDGKTGEQATAVQTALNEFKTAYTAVSDKTVKITITPLDK